jgi:hypothetical protein
MGEGRGGRVSRRRVSREKKKEKKKGGVFTFADAQEGELAKGDDGAAGREVSVEICVAERRGR